METGYEALRSTCAWIDLSARGKIRLIGEDAGRLLHAMCTNNIKELAPGRGIYAFFLNEKGRILADANIFNLGSEYWLDAEGAGASVIHHHLDKYIIADDAEVIDETSRWFEVGIEGPESAAAMQRLSLPLPDEPLAIIDTGWGYVARAASTGEAGFRVWAGEEKRLELYDQLAAKKIPQASENEAKTVRLESGIPVFGEDISERYLVQETQQLRAVSFSKGCYLGQDIVERIRSQGKVHRLLTSIRVSGSVAPPAGSKLVFNEAAAGEITSAAFSPTLGEVAAMAYLRSEVLDKRPALQITGMDPAITARVA